MRTLFCFLILTLSVSCSVPANADSIVLTNGTSVEGKILEKTAKYIKIESQGVTLTFYSDEIKSIDQNNSPSVVASSDASPSVASKDESAQSILNRMIQAYKAVQTYKTEGTSSMIMDTGGFTSSMQADFSIILKKPNMYLISWMGKGPMGPVETSPSAVWSNGEKPFLYQTQLRTYTKLPDDLTALSMARGLSFEAAGFVPMLFFYTTGDMSPVRSWTNLDREADETVNGVDCYVISASSPISDKETVWVSKSDFYVMRYSRLLSPPAGGFKPPEMSDEQLEASMKKMGMEVTPERKEAMRAQMQQMADKVKNIKLSGTSEQYFSDTSFPQLSKDDFKFDVPPDVVLKESFPSQQDMFADIQKNSGDKSIALLDQANNEEDRFGALGRAALAYYDRGNKDEAKKLTDELRALMPKYQDDKMYGDAVQYTNIIYGRIAVADGNIEDAKKYLLAAGNSPGSPVMDSFGPNMSLAKELLEKGQNDTVLQYFELCGKFWKMDYGKLKEWTEEVKNGKVPDFSTALIY